MRLEVSFAKALRAARAQDAVHVRQIVQDAMRQPRLPNQLRCWDPGAESHD